MATYGRERISVSCASPMWSITIRSSQHLRSITWARRQTRGSRASSSPVTAFFSWALARALSRTSIRSPWQNGVAERWVGSARRELLDHVIPLNECHLRRLGRDYLAYYHQDRTHSGLNKNTPAERAVESRSHLQTGIMSTSRLEGLHHRYRWSEAA